MTQHLDAVASMTRAARTPLIADIDTYKKGPEDDLYANFPVNYLKIDKTPGPEDDYSPILKSLRDGAFFATTGEILIRNYSVAGTGNQRTITADVDFTFPLSFVEVRPSFNRRFRRLARNRRNHQRRQARCARRPPSAPLRLRLQRRCKQRRS